MALLFQAEGPAAQLVAEGERDPAGRDTGGDQIYRLTAGQASHHSATC